VAAQECGRGNLQPEVGIYDEMIIAPALNGGT
jgi:hypothetical protein